MTKYKIIQNGNKEDGIIEVEKKEIEIESYLYGTVIWMLDKTKKKLSHKEVIELRDDVENRFLSGMSIDSIEREFAAKN